MKLKNKKTGDIVELSGIICKGDIIYMRFDDGKGIFKFAVHSLAELNSEWEDYEEPKEYWYIEPNGVIARIDEWDCCTENDREVMKLIGNYFDTREEAEKAVEKLKAWKRLKGGGFEFMSCSYGHDKTTDDTGGWIRFRVNHLYDERYGCEVEKDLDLLFGGEE